jgi:hypothetical protein
MRQRAPRRRIADHRQVDQQAAHVAIAQRDGPGMAGLDVAGPARGPMRPVVQPHGFAAGQEGALDGALRQRPIDAAVGVEQRALLQVQSGQTRQSTALHSQIDAPARAIDMHQLQRRLAQLPTIVEDLVRGAERP